MTWRSPGIKEFTLQEHQLTEMAATLGVQLSQSLTTSPLPVKQQLWHHTKVISTALYAIAFTYPPADAQIIKTGRFAIATKCVPLQRRGGMLQHLQIRNGSSTLMAFDGLN